MGHGHGFELALEGLGILALPAVTLPLMGDLGLSQQNLMMLVVAQDGGVERLGGRYRLL